MFSAGQANADQCSDFGTTAFACMIEKTCVRRQIIWDTRAVRRMDALVQYEIDYAACF